MLRMFSTLMRGVLMHLLYTLHPHQRVLLVTCCFAGNGEEHEALECELWLCRDESVQFGLLKRWRGR